MPGGAVCPACGVPVVPGYVRCPKCHKALPKVRTSTAVAEGGTAVEQGKSPLVIVGIGVVVVGAIVAFALHGRGGKTATAAPAPGSAAVTEVAPAPTVESTGNVAAPSAPRGPDPGAAVADLERTLRRQRLWSTVEVVGTTVNVRGGSCGDPGMTAALDGAVRAFKAAGLTKLRCLEQSGHVVVDRDL